MVENEEEKSEWNEPKIDIEEYKRLKEERNRLLREKETLCRQLEEAEDIRQYYEEQREKEKSVFKNVLPKFVIIALLAAIGIVSYKLYYNDLNSEESANVATSTTAQVGKYVKFGRYPYEADGTVKPIEWRVLANDGSKALLITKNGIDVVPYNRGKERVTWAESTIREGLNFTFIHKAFTDEERSRIIESRIENKYNAEYGTIGGNDTNDKLFLLSIEEAKKYFKSDKTRRVYPTPYASLKTGHITPCWWWLRSPGEGLSKAAVVTPSGQIFSEGTYLKGGWGGDIAVRVAFWLDLKNL